MLERKGVCRFDKRKGRMAKLRKEETNIRQKLGGDEIDGVRKEEREC